MDKVINIEEPEQKLADFLAMEPSAYKNFKYFNEIQGHSFRRVNLSYKGDTMYYSYQTLSVKRNGSAYYVKQSNKAGFTFENRKLKIWWGKNIKELPYLPVLLKELGMEWCIHEYHTILTKGILEKMLRGDITNPVDMCKAYLKAVRIKNVSPKLFSDLIKSGRIGRYDIFTSIEVAKDPNHYIEKMLDDNKIFTYIESDLTKQALILGRKIDFKWSDKRMRAEHEAWTKEIMDMEGENIDDTPLPLREFPLLDGMTLLNSQKKVWLEGKIMHHCVYTNYWQSIKNNSYLAYHIEMGDEVATLGVNSYGGNITFNQLYSTYNSKVSENLHNKVNTWIESINQQLKLKS